MRDFFKFLFASMLGFLLTLIILFFLFLGLISSIMSFSEKEVINVPENSILHIKFNQEINDRTPADFMFDFLSMEPSKQIGLNDILKNLEKAKVDNNIKGIYMELTAIPTGKATLQEIREALIDFKESGKFIITYSELMGQGAYYLASVSDKIYLNPEAILLFKGLSSQRIFYKDLMEKLDVEAQIIRGKNNKFKSAVEPYMLDEMSDASRQQTEKYLNSIWGKMLEDIAASRNITVDELNKVADKISFFSPDELVEKGLIDGLKYKDEILSELKERIGIGQESDISAMSMTKYINAPDYKEVYPRKKIAVIYATGTILSGEGDDTYIGSGLSKTIREARLDERTKAIVFRINSGGGDVIASEVIRREIELAAKVKPVIVSYGDVSASGGYWCTCQGTKIIASENTITGSIGVFAMIPNIKGLLNDKLGINIDVVNTNKSADFGNIARPLSSYEKAVMQENVESTYQKFIGIVAEARGLRTSFVDSIGQGRVWAAKDAIKLGLIDEFGGLNRAIELAAEAAELDEYMIRELPVQKDAFEKFFESWAGNAQTSFMKARFGSAYKYVKHIEELQKMQGVQARMPYELIIE